MKQRVFKKALEIGLGLALLALAAACGPSAGEIDARIATAVASLPTATPQPTATPITIPTPLPTATPMPIPTPQPTATSISIPTPLPTATPITFPMPLPTPTPMRTATPVVFPTALPTATPQPTATPISLPALAAITSAASGPVTTSVGGQVTLRIEPGRPIAGRDISFLAAGLEPWEQFQVGFIDPLGVAAEWITEDESTYTRVGGRPVVTRTLYADGDGQAGWVRVGTLDLEGVWQVRLTSNGQELRVSYPVAQMQLEVTPEDRLGLDFRLYQGSVTDSYVSALVPVSLAIDLQATLLLAVENLRERLGYQSQQIPDLYLLGNESLFRAAAEAAGTEVGWEVGFQWSGQPFPGIFMRTDFLRTSLQQTVIHEYVHLLLNEAAPATDLPAWLNEGAATYYELSLGLGLQRPDVPRREAFQRADSVREVALANALIPLTQLESQQVWNQRTGDIVSFQYSEAYLAVRYLIERFGEPSLPQIVARLKAGDRLDAALQSVTGISYGQFQQDYVAWARAWEDPEQEAILEWYQEARSIMDGWSSLSAQRAREMRDNSSATLSSRVSAKQALVTAAKALQDRARLLVPPDAVAGVHSELVSFLERGVAWLQLELDWASTGNDARRVQANNMIPEIDARENNMVLRQLADLRYVYQLN